MNNFTYSKDGMQLTESFESCRLIPYRDQRGIWTNGWGNTHGVVPGVPITQAQADADLLANVQDAVNTVNRVVTYPLNQDEFDALVDFAFNCGITAFANSTLLKYLNLGDLKRVEAEFLKWNHTNGQINAGLTRRRVAEEKLFETPSAATPPVPAADAPGSDS